MTTVTAGNATAGPGDRSPRGGVAPLTLRDIVTAPAFIACTAVLGLAFVLLFSQWFVRQNRLSIDAIQDWGHAYAVPFIAGFLIWRRRDELLAARPCVFWPGLIPLLTGLFCYFFFIVGVPNHMFQGFSMLLTLFGVLLLLLGPEPMRVLLLPIMFLALGVTIAEIIMIKVTFTLQQIAAQGAWVLLSFIGKLSSFTVDLHGNALTILTSSGKTKDLDVAQACSGMRMVVAFIALGATVALVSCRHWWQRAALLLLTIPVAVFMNIIRVAVLGLASMLDADLAKGDAHMLIGTVLLIPGLGLFMGVVWILQRVVNDGPEAAPSPTPVLVRRPEWRLLRTPAFIVSVAVLGIAAGGLRAAVQQAKIYLQKLPIYAPEGRRLVDLPRKTGGWEQRGVDDVPSKEVQEELGTDNSISRLYVTREDGPNGRITDPEKFFGLQFHAAYYTNMVDTVPHVPERCFVGGGMQIVKQWGQIPIPLNRSKWREDDSVPERLRGRIFEAPLINEVGNTVRYVRLPRDPADIKLLVTEFANAKGERLWSGYFFIANGGAVASAEGVRLLAFNLTDSYAYYLKVQFTSGSATSAEHLAAQAGALLDDMLPHLMQSVPDWVEVESGDYPPDNPLKKSVSQSPSLGPARREG